MKIASSLLLGLVLEEDLVADFTGIIDNVIFIFDVAGTAYFVDKSR